MWDPATKKRFQHLRAAEAERRLTPVEAEELADLLRRADEQEAAQLAPAIQRLREERRLTQEKNRELEGVLRRQEVLAARLRGVIAEATREQQSIRDEV